MKSYLRLWGRSIVAPFVAVIVLVSGNCLAAEETLKLGGTGGALGTMQQLADAYALSHPGVRVQVLPSLGSSGGIKAVLAGAIQIAVSSRPIKEAELKRGALVVEYARTPFVFATSVPARVDGISTAELVEIYGGRISSWPDGRRIHLVLRPAGDSDSDLLKSISAAMREAGEAAEMRKGMLFGVTDQEAADLLEKTPGSLGTSTLAQILSERRRLKPLKLDGAEPSPANIANGSYPLHKSMFLVTGPASSAAARDFVDFVRSAAGREILERQGHWAR